MSRVRPPRIKLAKRTYSEAKRVIRNDSAPSDSSGHSLTETALHESETFYRQMFEQNRAVKLVIDPVTLQIFKANQAACDYYGYTAEQFKTLHITELITLTEAQLRENIQDILRDTSRQFQAEHRLASGEIRNTEVFTGILDLNGKIYLYAIIQDITKRKQTEKALRESETLYRILAQHMPNSSVVMFDRDLRFTLAEGPYLNRFGEVWRNAIGKHPQDVYSKETLERLLPIFESALQGETLNFERVTEDYAYESYIAPVHDDNGELTGGIVLSHDITKRKQAEKALRESELRFHSLVDLAPVGIIQTDVNGNRVFCNSRWCEMTGITLEQALGDIQYETIYPDDFEIASGAWEKMMETRQSFENLVFRYQRSDKSVVWVSGNGRPLVDPSGTVTGYIGSVIDITESRSTQEKLRQERDLMRTLIDHMPDYIFLKDAEGRFVLTNEAHAKAGGITPASAMIGKTAFDVFSSDLARQFYEDDLAIMQSGKPLINAERKTVDTEGNLKTVLTTKIPWQDAKGNILGLIGISRDISERKELEEALLTSELRFRTLIDFAPVGIVETDSHGNLLLANSQWHKLSSIPEPYEFIDNAAGTIHPDDYERVQQIRKESMAQVSDVANAEYRFVHPDGSVVWVSDSSRTLRDPNGAFTGHIITMTDITERKRLEEELRKNEERLRVITDNTQDLITQNDAKGTLIFVSQSSRNMLGYEPEALLKMQSIELVHPDDRVMITQVLQKAIEAGTEYLTVEARLRHADGHYIWAESIIKFVRDVESNITGSVFISRDISERKRIQTLMLETEKLETALDRELELNDLKTRMMSRIAHEFRTPLTVIQASTETLTHYFDRLTPVQRDSKEGIIKGQIQRLTDMLDEISLVMNGSFTPEHVHRVKTDVGLLCRQVAAQLEQQINQPGRFVLDIPEKTEGLVDPHVLKNGLIHVIRNAARFSSPDDVVRISLARDENNIFLRVRDTGIGLLPNEQSRVFEPFFRGSNISQINGLGIGLTIARAAVEAHDGTITVESVLNQETTVTIQIPIKE